MVLAYEIRRIRDTLIFARKALSFAVVVQLPILVILLARAAHIQWNPPLNVFWLLNGVSCVLGIVGFVIACRQLNLIDETLDDAPLPDFLKEGRFPGSGKVLASAQLLFYGLFLIPLVNALLFLWARIRAQQAIAGIDGVLERLRRAPQGERPVTIL